ncbi:hypothetical protein IAI44_07635 [Bacillus cereus]|uniref:hypothetical protein n=1 Tax=Bacillus cereus TaxID=1396 RepID=UPI0035C6DF6C
MPDDINQKVAKHISEVEKAQIDEIIEVSGLITEDKTSSCEENCDDAHMIAQAACLTFTNPIAIAACLVVAKKAHRECRKRC